MLVTGPQLAVPSTEDLFPTKFILLTNQPPELCWVVLRVQSFTTLEIRCKTIQKNHSKSWASHELTQSSRDAVNKFRTGLIASGATEDVSSSFHWMRAAGAFGTSEVRVLAHTVVGRKESWANLTAWVRGIFSRGLERISTSRVYSSVLWNQYD